VSLLNKKHTIILAILAFVVALPLALPVLSIVVLALLPADNIWPHLIATVLPHYLVQTFLLLTGVGILTFVIGVTLAWLVTLHEFPGSKFLQWLALLPLAMPGYIVSYTYVDFFTYAGPLQSFLRGLMGWQRPSDYYFPEIRSMGGAILVLGFVLYPYVYISARAAFLKQSMTQIDVARTLGKSPWKVFSGIILPQARPAIVVGLTLVLMECLNDIAAVGFFGVQTLTLGIYSTWLGQGNLGGAAQLAFVMLLCVGGLLAVERYSRGRDQRLHLAHKPTPIIKQPLSFYRGWLAFIIMSVPIFAGFILPAFLLLKHAARRIDAVFSPVFLNALGHSLLLAGIACVLTLMAGLVLAYANRLTHSYIIRVLTTLATLGYAIPGTVLGIGLLVPLGHFDNWLDANMRTQFGVSTGLLLSGSYAALALAYMARFLVMAFGSLENGLHKITPNVDAVARTLGRKPLRVLFDIHIPLMQPAIIAGALLVFVDAMKELPATLILSPFDFNTLATHVFTLASLDKLEDSAVPALAIVLAGLIPVILLSKNLRDPAIGARHETAASAVLKPAS
jgi:iron(III) transport system permease protein